MLGLPAEGPDCNRCELRAGCGRVVWGKGACSPANILFLGEHPGAEEDLMGEPFLSREGRMLTRLIDSSGIDRTTCYFTYAVKCMGAPGDENVNACRGWLWQELRKTAPKVVVTLGALPARLLLGLKKSFRMADVVGRFHVVSYMGSVVAPWYAPGYVLQHGKTADRDTIEFLKTVWEKCQ